jgi:F420H(2)-dependent quinone reductase
VASLSGRGGINPDKDKLASDTAALDGFNRGIVDEFRVNDGKVGTDGYDVVAHELPREERNELYARATQLAPVLADYQTKTDRVIPLFELTRE